MPLVPSNYNPPHLFKNGHFSTIYSGLIRQVKGISQERERIQTPDNDFIDIDWSYSVKKTEKAVVILHGLEGNAQRPYITGSAKIFNENNFDAVSINYRSCSGLPNKTFKSYHSGATNDVELVIHHLIKKGTYKTIVLNGFSLGGNLVLKYLGTHNIPKEIKTAVAVSVPCDLYGSMLEIHKLKNTIYAKRFKKTLLKKLRQKQVAFPGQVSLEEIDSIKTLKDFDDLYTSRAHGFYDALDYYDKSSSVNNLKNIEVPCLILNAQNDSFLSPSCYPSEISKNKDNLYLEIPKYGGHVGFFDRDNVYYNEKRAIAFVKSIVK
ncbi:alpha/beta fold hydrolase [Galbibacter sp. PAP.153]|uniref:YheT family hydrolase n=1 Tax=Galbibacter sp. PAP.153 TaxID=3104623 RepID=UPI003009607D